MKRSFWLALALPIAATLASTSGAYAYSYPLVSANVYSVAPGTSDGNMRWAAARIERDIDMLQRDRHDYGGHRVAAIADFQAAGAQIGLGLAYDAGAESKIAALKAAMHNAGWMRGGCGSDSNLRYARRDIEQVIDVLQRDNTDYGGHRVAAIADLQKGRNEIVGALIYDATH